MKKVIVTGATSFIGVNLIKQLLVKDVMIYAIVRPNSEKIELLPRSNKVIVVELNMCDYHLLPDKMIESCDILYALAWNGTRGSARADRSIQEENFENSMKSVKSAQKLGCNCVVSAGSQAEYGNIQGLIQETTIPKPNTEYGKWKLRFFTEAYAYCKEQHISFKEPRFFSLYGEGDYEGTLIMSVLRKMKENEPCELTECIQSWDYLYIRDAVKAIIALGFQKCADGAYNLGSGDTRILKSFIEEMYRITNSKSELHYGAIPYPETGMVSIAPDITKLQRELHFIPEYTFEKGIRKIVKNIGENRL